MPRFSAFSRRNLREAYPSLQRLFHEVIKHWDCIVLDGERSIEEQVRNVEKGVSMTMKSKHLEQRDGTAHAVDVVPYPIKWGDTERMYAFGGFVLGVATMMGIRIRWGGDWDGDREVKDQRFTDLPHFEVVL